MDDDDKLIIYNDWSYGCNRCIVCNGFFKHTRKYIAESPEAAEKGVFILNECVGHRGCITLVNRLQKKQKEIERLNDLLMLKKGECI